MCEPESSEDASKYLRVLLRGKREDLRTIERLRRQQLNSVEEYLSCRRSLLQAIHELRDILRAQKPVNTR
jgi:hypothetical protein